MALLAVLLQDRRDMLGVGRLRVCGGGGTAENCGNGDHYDIG